MTFGARIFNDVMSYSGWVMRRGQFVRCLRTGLRGMVCDVYSVLRFNHVKTKIMHVVLENGSYFVISLDQQEFIPIEAGLIFKISGSN